MDKLNFSEAKAFHSQHSLVNFLQDFNYYFKRINDYDNNHFYLMLDTRCDDENESSFTKKAKKLFGQQNQQLGMCMQFSIQCCNGDYISKPLVLNRQEVQAIFDDIPQNYVGDMEI